MSRSIYIKFFGVLYYLITLTVQASVQRFSGEINSSITDSTTSSATLSEKTNTSLENWIYVDVQGQEEFNNQLNILYKISSLIYNASLDGNDTPISAYNTYLGLESILGTVLVGRNDTVFKFSEGNVDLFNSTNADIGNLAAGQVISADAIWYYSPKIANIVSLNSTYLMTNNQDPTIDNVTSQYAFTATIGDKNLLTQQYYFSAAYNKGIDSINAYRQVGQMKLGNAIIGTLYQYAKSIKSNESNMKGNTYFINIKYPLNGINFKAEYGKDTSGLGWYFTNVTGDSNQNTDRSRYSDISIEQITIGADYMLSTSTRLYTHAILFRGHYKNAGLKTSLENDKVFTIGIDFTF